MNHPKRTLAALLALAALACGGCARTVADGAGPTGAAGLGEAAAFVADAGDRVFFDTDGTDLDARAEAALDRQAAWLKRHPGYAFTVEGHADERGTREYNFALGEKRARNVEDYLRARGIAASRMRIVSYGKERPVATCDDASCWSLNRRAVTVLAAPQS